MANVKLASKSVGDIVKLKVNGTAKEFIVVHQGKPSSVYDESCNGTWLLMKDIYENRVWQSGNVNKYESSDIHTYLNNTFLNLFDSNIKNAIKQVKIPYRKNGGSGGTDQSGANGLPCKVFLLSGYELGWTNINLSYFPVDGAKLDYFTASSGGDSKRIAYLNGSAVIWWLRSPNTINTRNVLGVSYNGSYSGGEASVSYGIRPALILPPDMKVDSSGNVTPPPPATHKTLVNGTAYEVKSGKCLVNGTAYSIKKGRTLIGGTGYDIAFEETIGKTWRFNDVISCWEGMTWNVNFVALGYPCTSIYSTYNNNLFYTTPSLGGFMARDAAGNWNGEEYRTVTFDEPPTGDFLTWLQANATPQ